MKRVLLLTWACASGCGFAAFGGTPPKPCQNDSDCGSGEVCLDIGCAAPQQNLVAQVVLPSGNPSVATQDFPDIDTSGALSLTLGPPAMLDLNADAYPFTLAISGVPLHLPDQPYAPSTAAVSGPSSDAIALATGDYQFLATPKDATLPPVAWSAAFDDPGETTTFNITFGDGGTVVRFDGALTGRPLLTSALAYTVQLSRDDGTPVSQPALAATPDGGGPLSFSLYLARSQQDADLQLTATPQVGVGPIVTYEGKLDDLRALASDGGLSLGDAVPAQASGVVVDSAGTPVAGAQIKLLATLPGHARFASKQVSTDATGAFQVSCLHDLDDPSGSSESYQVLVIPAPGSPLAITEIPAAPRWTGSAGVFGTVAVDKLADVSGRVLDSTGAPVSSAQVQATPAPENTLPLVGVSATTSTDGTFHLALTPGSYYFDVTPPLSLQAPRASRGPVVVSTPKTDLGDVQFSAGRTVSGIVAGPDGQPIADASVRIYFVPPAGSTVDGTTPRSQLLAQTYVTDGGAFSVVLPAPPTHNK